jgi:predicted alpha/beta-fold hydrolase
VSELSEAGEYRYRPAWWLPGGHAQTLWGKFIRRRLQLGMVQEVIQLPDGDHLELHTLACAADAPRLLLLHGLEGGIKSHYVHGIVSAAAAAGWGATLMVFRGCGSTPNTARRFYHSGETTDVAHVYALLRARAPNVPWFTIGVSLGGNVMLKWLGELGGSATIAGAVAISVPFDLEAGSRKISRGSARIYDQHFLKQLRGKALRKLESHPGLFDKEALLRATSVYGFDDVVTAPVHGFADAHDYYSQSSSLAYLSRIRVPTLLISSRDDPFLPAAVLDRMREIATGNPALHAEIHEHGGHVGFVGGAWPWSARYYVEHRALGFLRGAGGRRARGGLP